MRRQRHEWERFAPDLGPAAPEKPQITFKAGRFPIDIEAQIVQMNRWTPPRFVYRFLQKREDAQAFLKGKIWVTTLDHIRTTDEARGDQNEAVVKVEISHYDPQVPGRATDAVRQRIGGLVAGDIVMQNVAVTHSHPNAYLLCTTEMPDERLKLRFGENCVRIEHPERFLQILGRAIHVRFPLRDPMMIGAMQYGGRKFQDAEGEIGHIAFMNVAGNADEREVRMLWLPQEPDQIDPLLISCPEAGAMCKLMT